jgi:hypothetical protein
MVFHGIKYEYFVYTAGVFGVKFDQQNNSLRSLKLCFEAQSNNAVGLYF